MVYVTHHRNNRCAGLEIFFSIFHLGHSILHLCTDVFGLVPKFLGYNVDGLCFETLVDADHHTDVHTRSDDFRYGNIHHRCELVGCHKLGELEHLALCFFFPT